MKRLLPISFNRLTFAETAYQNYFLYKEHVARKLIEIFAFFKRNRISVDGALLFFHAHWPIFIAPQVFLGHDNRVRLG